MFREEAIWLKEAILKIQPFEQNNLVANLGSSTGYFRKVIQPHIHEYIIQTLQNNGWEVVHVDIKQEEGVDVVADVTRNDFTSYIKPSALTICTNMLEHVEDISLVIKNLQNVTIKGGYILITVPYKYKKHLDPIDNMFRPTPQEIADLFNPHEIEIITQKIIEINDKEYYKVKKSKIPLWGYRNLIGYYLGKKHKVSGILIKMK